MNEPIKKVLLAVSFGTSFAETREKTIGAIEKKIQTEFPDFNVKRCFTSRMIRKKLLERDNLRIDSPEDTIRQVVESGIAKVIIQPLYLMHGTEHRRLMDSLEEYRDSFDCLAVGKPLLSEIGDFQVVAKAILSHLPASDPETAVVLMGHGNAVRKKKKAPETETPAQPVHIDCDREIPAQPAATDCAREMQAQPAKTDCTEENPEQPVHIDCDREIPAQPAVTDCTREMQAQPAASDCTEENSANSGLNVQDNAVFEILQRTLFETGADNYFIATVEGEPELKDIFPVIRDRGFKKIILAPLMIVAGDHALNDLAGEQEDSWKNIFSRDGFQTNTVLRGIGEWEEVQGLFAAHASEAANQLNSGC